MHMRAAFDGVAFELLQIVCKVGQRMFLDPRSHRSQVLPLRQALALPVALLAQIPQSPVVELEMIACFDETGGRFSMVDTVHAAAPLRIWAIWINLIGRLSRSAHPFWCMRHDMSADTRYSAPAFWWSVTLS